MWYTPKLTAQSNAILNQVYKLSDLARLSQAQSQLSDQTELGFYMGYQHSASNVKYADQFSLLWVHLDSKDAIFITSSSSNNSYRNFT